MANSAVSLLRQRIADNPLDNEAWEMLVEELWSARALPGMLDRVMETLSRIVELYPAAGKYWKMLTDIELDRNNIDGAVQLFGRCLVKCFNMDLWNSYMRFIKLTNSNKGDEGKLQVMRAYDYVLNRLGDDSEAGPVWLEFIGFMSGVPPGSAAFQLLFEPEVGKEASKRALRLRDLYQRALQVPCVQLDQLWKDYERFEHTTAGRNSLTAVRFVDEARPRFFAAREAWAKRSRFLSALERDALPWTPGKSPSSARFAEQRTAWQAFLEFETSNVQGLDPTALKRRVDLAYQQACQPLRCCPEVWYEWATAFPSEREDSRRTHMLSVLGQASAALPDCVMLAFALADVHEQHMEHDEALKVYEGIAERLEANNDALSAEPGSTFWMQFMQFQQRSAGNPVDAQTRARKVFIRARKWPHCTWHVFAFHALMEWHHNRVLQPAKMDVSVKIVKSIFELGLRQPAIQAEPRYIEAFANWLVSSTGDVDNARLLYQNALADEAVLRNPAMWSSFLQFEARHGSIQEITSVETQWLVAMKEAKAAVPRDNRLHHMRQRYSFFDDLWPCTLEQRQYLEARQRPEQAAAGRFTTGSTHDSLPASLALFISKLPPMLEPEQPVPDVDFVVDVILNTQHMLGAESEAALTSKRTADSLNTGGGAGGGTTDLFHLRQRRKVEA